MNKFTILEHLRACAETVKAFAGSLVSELAQTVLEAMTEMESTKADRSDTVSITIPETGWSSDNDTDYPKYYDISAAGITAKDRAGITIAPASLGTAKSCGLCPTNETLAGKIRIRSTSVPTAAIAAQYWIEQGKEN